MGKRGTGKLERREMRTAAVVERTEERYKRRKKIYFKKKKCNVNSK
jgi:hypothetical protein